MLYIDKPESTQSTLFFQVSLRIFHFSLVFFCLLCVSGNKPIDQYRYALLAQAIYHFQNDNEATNYLKDKVPSTKELNLVPDKA